jgi:3-oxoacyl-[acyl-carrier-protein] synthase-1
MAIYLSSPGVVCCAGSGLAALHDVVLERKPWHSTDLTMKALVDDAIGQIRGAVDLAVNRYGNSRIGVFVGSCDNGTCYSLPAHKQFFETGSFPTDYSFTLQKAAWPAAYIQEKLGLKGPAAACATACASSASAIIKACQLIKAGFCDAAVAGGVDIASRIVLSGFGALEALSPGLTNPFSKNRDGISLGDGSAFFVIAREDLWKTGMQLLGWGESSDASHITAPEESGTGAAVAIKKALASAGLRTADIDYINLHGTGTKLNDLMESRAVARNFGPEMPPVSSTKPVTGHTLGAAGALELAICSSLITMNDGKLPPQLWDGEKDEELEPLNFVEKEKKYNRIRTCMSNTFGFGGCNVSLIIGERDDNY